MAEAFGLRLRHLAGVKAVAGVWLASAIFAIALTLLGIDRFVTYHSGADLGEFVQAIASPLAGLHDTVEGSHFLHHFSPLLYLWSPALLLAHSEIVLIAIQEAAAALVAPPLFLLLRRRVDERLALLVAIVALVYPPLVGVAFTDFHENGFAPAAIAWLAWAIDARRWRIAAFFAAIALAVKEDEAAMLLVLGAGFAVWAARLGDRVFARFAAGVAVAAAATLTLYFGLILPLAAHGYFALAYFGADMPQPQGIVAQVLGRISYLLEAFVPLCFVPLVRRHVLYVIPGLIEVLASRWSITYTMGQHYAGVWVGEMLVAYALTIAALAAARGATFARRLAVASLVLCLLNLSLASPTHWGHYLRARTAHDAVLDAVLRELPPDAAIGSFDEVYAHLGFDPNAVLGIAGDPQYILLDRNYPSAYWRDVVTPQVRALVATNRYRLVRSTDGVELFERVPSRATLLRTLGATAVALLPPRPGAPQGLKTVRTGASLDDGITPLLYGMHAGLYARAGLDIELQSSSSGAALAQAVAGRTIDVAKSSLMSLITAYARGIKFKLIAGAALYSSDFPTTQLCVLRDSPVKTALDLGGKTIAVTALQSLETIAIDSLIDQRGGHSELVRFIEMPASTMLGALDQGRADMAAIPNPALADALATGKIRTFAAPYSGLGKHVLIGGWFCSEDYAKANPEVVEKFAAATREAILYTNAHHAETVPLLAAYAHLDPEVIKRMNRATNAATLDVTYIQPAIDAAVKYKLIERGFPASELIATNL